jgi:hypothetical protein
VAINFHLWEIPFRERKGRGKIRAVRTLIVAFRPNRTFPVPPNDGARSHCCAGCAGATGRISLSRART